MDERKNMEQSTLDRASYEAEESALLSARAFKSQPRMRRLWLWFHFALIIAYSMMFLLAMIFVRSGTYTRPVLTWSPANQAVKHELLKFDSWYEGNGQNQTLFGKPSGAIDDAWESLLAPMNTAYSKKDVERIGFPFADPVIMTNGQYLGSLTVYHHLHCIKRLYRSFNMEHYFPNLSAEEEILLYMHNMHCLDYLRRAVMCQGDITPILLVWAREQAVPIADMGYQHTCVNWDRLEQWAVGRSVNPYTPGLVVHPIYGPSYANLGPADHSVGLANASPLHEHSNN